VHSDWLFSCTDWALFSCDDWALLARCPRHIQTVFNPYGHQCYGQLTALKRGVRWPGSPECITGPTVQPRWCFFKVVCWPVVGLNWLQSQVYNEPSLFGHNREISDLGLDVLSLLNTSRPQSEITLWWPQSCLTSSTWSTLWGLSKLQCTVHGLC